MRSDLRLEPRQGISKTSFWATGMEIIQFLCPRISSSTLMMNGAAWYESRQCCLKSYCEGRGVFEAYLS